MKSYERHDYVASAEEREITKNNLDTHILYENLGMDAIKAKATVTVLVGTKRIEAEAEGKENVQVIGPNFQSNDGCFIVSYDNKIMNVQGG